MALGLLIEIYPGRDNHARVAKVKTAFGMKIRPFQKLYPLDIENRKGMVILSLNNTYFE